MKMHKINAPSLVGMGVLIGFIALFSTSCDLFDNDDAAIPEVTGVRFMDPDTAEVRDLEEIGPGDLFVIEGNNLSHVKEVYFNGIRASFNPVYVTDSHMIITVPDINFQELDPDSEEMNTIRVVSDAGEHVFEIPIAPPPPSISHLSREYGEAGHTIRIYGASLFLIREVYFPGEVPATDVFTSDDGSYIDAEIPEGVTQGGAITVETTNETITTPPSASFNDMTGMLCNFDDVDTYDWGANITDDASLFPGATGTYAYMETDEILPDNWAWWEDSRSVNLEPMEWIDPQYHEEATQDWAIKFDVNIREPIEYGTVLIRTDDDWNYIARYEPWEDEGEPYATDGWITETIPLSEFRTDDGHGEQAPSIDALHVASEAMGFMFVNDEEEEEEIVDEVMMAFDNIRAVRIAE